ncbi:MAG: hypothetical protein QOI10_1853 [Solirubrobacterales bacterium]|nr:hypothetical protein [Solirubrobacterales bacterium]
MLRRIKPRRRTHPALALLGDLDYALLRWMRTRGHPEPLENAMKALGTAGEYGAVWAVTGAIGASVDERRRGQYLAAGLTGPLAIGVNYLVKVAVGRRRPLIEDHPPLSKAPSKLSFPSAHATSSVAAATALGRVQPLARPYLFGLAAAICAGRPYLGMHYPSDVLAGAALGFCIGSLVPGLGAPHAEERLFDLAVDANERAQASRRAGGNGGAAAPVASGAPGSAEADTGPTTA